MSDDQNPDELLIPDPRVERAGQLLHALATEHGAHDALEVLGYDPDEIADAVTSFLASALERGLDIIPAAIGDDDRVGLEDWRDKTVLVIWVSVLFGLRLKGPDGINEAAALDMLYDLLQHARQGDCETERP